MEDTVSSTHFLDNASNFVDLHQKIFSVNTFSSTSRIVPFSLYHMNWSMYLDIFIIDESEYPNRTMSSYTEGIYQLLAITVVEITKTHMHAMHILCDGQKSIAGDQTEKSLVYYVMSKQYI